MEWWVWLIATATVINIGIIFGCLVRIEKIETKMNQIYKQALKEKETKENESKG